MKYTPVGVDIAKHVIQIHFINENTGEVVDKLIRRQDFRKRTARAVLTGMCYSAGSAMRHGSSSLTRLAGQSAMTPSTWKR